MGVNGSNVKKITVINENKEQEGKQKSIHINSNNSKPQDQLIKNKSSNTLCVENSATKNKFKTRRPLNPKTKKISILDQETLLKNLNNNNEKNSEEILLFGNYLNNDIKQNKKAVARNVGDYYIKNTRKNSNSDNENSENENYNRFDKKKFNSKNLMEKIDLNDKKKRYKEGKK